VLWPVLTLSVLVFSVVDWRMTKHLALMLIPLVLALAPARTAPKWRVAVPIVTALLMVVFNLWSLQSLTQNFMSFTITPAW